MNHGEARTRLYKVWTCIKQRCGNPRYRGYMNYGARGIKLCEQWRTDYVPFRDWATSSGYEQGLTIDRIDNDGDYCPENCRWVAGAINKQNTRRSRHYEAFGEAKFVSEWSRDFRCAVSLNTLNGRLRRGWDFFAALTTPGVREQDEHGRFRRPASVVSAEFVPYRPA